MRVIKSLSLVILIGIAVIGLTVKSARASVLTFYYTAVVVSSNVHVPPLGPLTPTDVALGALISGTFEYDADAPIVPGAPLGTRYAADLGAVSFQMASGTSLSAGASNINIIDAGFTLDQFVIDARLPGPSFTDIGYTLDSSQLTVFFRDLNGDVFTSSTLPTFLNLNDFTTAKITLTGSIAGGFKDTVVADFTSITLVPIPAALPLFLTGLAGLGLMRRRKRQALRD